MLQSNFSNKAIKALIKILYHSTFDYLNVFSSLRNPSILSTPPPKSHSINSTLLLRKTTLHFQPNKNKIPQLGQSPKSLENLILSILQPFLFIHPRHQCYQLDMRSLREHINWINFVKVITLFLEEL